MSTAVEQWTLDEVEALREGWDFEAKKAAGKDGAHPRDLRFLLRRLVADRFLDPHGDRRGAWYSPQTPPQTPPQTSTQTSIFDDETNVIAWVSTRSWAPKERVELAIMEVCRGRFVSAREIAETLGRARRTIVDNYVSPMVADGRLELRDPDQPSSATQAYRTVEVGS